MKKLLNVSNHVLGIEGNPFIIRFKTLGVSFCNPFS